MVHRPEPFPGMPVMVGFFIGPNSPGAYPGIVSEVCDDGTLYVHVFARNAFVVACRFFTCEHDARSDNSSPKWSQALRGTPSHSAWPNMRATVEVP